MFNFNRTPPKRLTDNIAALVRVFVLTAFLVAAVQSSAFAADWRNLTVYNYTGFEIKGLYISSSEDKNWGTNLLGDITLINGSSSTISYNADYRYFDLKIVFMNDSYREWTGSQKRDFKNACRIILFDSKLKQDNGTQIFHAVVERNV